MLVSKVRGSRVELHLSHDGTTENFQRYTAKLEDGTTLTVYIPRANFVHVMPNTVNNRGQDLSNIIMFQSRQLATPNPIVVEPDPAPTPRKTTRSTKRKK